MLELIQVSTSMASPYKSLLLVFSVTPFKIYQNKNQNRPIDKVQNLGNERRYIYKDPRQDSGQRNISYTRYPKKCFTQIYRVVSLFSYVYSFCNTQLLLPIFVSSLGLLFSVLFSIKFYFLVHVNQSLICIRRCRTDLVSIVFPVFLLAFS